MLNPEPDLYMPRTSKDAARILRETAPSLTRRDAQRLAATLGIMEPPETRTNAGRPSAVFRAVAQIGRLRQEQLRVLCLDSANGILANIVASVGRLNITRTHPREIFAPAIGVGALGIVLAHNHPSGLREPSEEDFEFTRAIYRAGELLGIELYDHLIIVRDGYTSLRERGAFPQI